MLSTRKPVIGLKKIVSILVIGLFASNANAKVVDWWSYRTSSANVVEFGGNVLRLEGGFNDGFIEGVVNLPTNENWQLDFKVQTDESSFIAPSEYVKLFINGDLIGQVFNSPPLTRTPFSVAFAGDQIDYRFEFSSPSIRFTDHMIVLDGTVNTVSAVPVPPVGVLFLTSLPLLFWRNIRQKLNF
jgi:hypothetical protein